LRKAGGDHFLCGRSGVIEDIHVSCPCESPGRKSRPRLTCSAG
jgi:hypothetical protein